MTITNCKVSENFKLYEFIESIGMPKKAIALNWKHITELNIEEIRYLAEQLEKVRRDTNEKFQHLNEGREIGLTVTAGFRCLEWEHLQKRSGKGEHPKSKAADVIPANVNKELSDKIIYYWDEKYSPRIYGWDGGFAIKKPTKKTSGFAHFDTRENIARWEY